MTIKTTRRGFMRQATAAVAGSTFLTTTETPAATRATPSMTSHIASVQTFRAAYPVVADFKFLKGKDGKPPVRETVVVKITDTEGRVGWGQSVPSHTWSYETLESVRTTIDLYLGPALIGQDAFDAEAVETILNRTIAPSFSTGQPICKAGIDLALFDLTGRILGQTAADRWGRRKKRRDRITISWTVNVGTLQDAAREVQVAGERGFGNFNLKLGAGAEFDVALCREIRRLAPDAFVWADANGDGHLDIVVACELAHLIYFQNPGSNAQEAAWKRTIPPITTNRGSYIRVYFADLDGDGRPEVVAANKGDRDGQGESQKEHELKSVSIFLLPEEPLDGELWREQVIGKLKMPVNAQPVDIDADGDLDIVAGTRGERRILWYENLGNMRFVARDIVISGLTQNMMVTGFNMNYADIDGDGRLDIVVNAWFNSLLWLRQPAEFDLPWQANLIGEFTPDFLASLELADIDSDGDLDVFSGGYSRGPRDNDGPDTGVDDPLSRISWFENPGVNQETQWQRHDISRRKRGMYDQWRARDMDDDGDLDMVGTRGNSFPFDGVIWLEQVRSRDAQPAFKQSREVESEQMPLPTVDQPVLE